LTPQKRCDKFQDCRTGFHPDSEAVVRNSLFKDS
jgi:hypothetical protein